MALATLRLLTVIPPPALIDVAPVRLVPARVTATVLPAAPKFGVMEVNVGGGVVTWTVIGSICWRQLTHVIVTVAERVLPGVSPVAFTVRLMLPAPLLTDSVEAGEVASQFPPSVCWLICRVAAAALPSMFAARTSMTPTCAVRSAGTGESGARRPMDTSTPLMLRYTVRVA